MAGRNLHRKSSETTKKAASSGSGGHKNAPRETSPPQAPGATTMIERLASDPFGRALLIPAAALLVAMPLVPGELVAVLNDGLLITAGWLLLAGLQFLHLACRVKTQEKERPTFRFGIVDLLLVAFLMWHSVAAVRAVIFESPRPAITLFFYYLGFGAMYLSLRAMLTTSLRRRALLAVMIGLTAAMSVQAVYEKHVSIPATIRDYESDPERSLQQAGVHDTDPNSSERKLIEGRLYDAAPTGTFVLTNSLAGLLVPWWVLITGTSFCAAAKLIPIKSSKEGTKKKSAQSSDSVGKLTTNRLLTMAAGSGAILALMLYVMFLTRCRSGMIGFTAGVCGAFVLSYLQVIRRVSPKHSARFIGIGVAVIGLLLATTVLAVVLEPDLIDGAKSSLGVRLEYWRSSGGIIADHPLLGCGPGNFGDSYLAYKLPEASEEIKDPHNFVVEIAATAGTPAAGLFLLFLVGVFIVSLRPLLKNSDIEKSQETAQGLDDISPKYIAWGAALGLPLAFTAGDGGLPELSVGLLLAVFAAILLVYPLSRWVRGGSIPVFVPTLALFALMLHLLAAGGISSAGVCCSVWVLSAVGMNESRRGVPAQTHRIFIYGGVACLFMSLAVASYIVAYHPTHTCRLSLNRLERRSYDASQAVRDAVEADPLNSEARLYSCQAAIERWTAASPEQRPTLWDAYEAERREAIRIRPRGATQFSTLGKLEFTAYEAVGDALILELAIKDFEAAARHYPNSAQMHADLALALKASGDEEGFSRHALRALELHEATSYFSNQLPDETREELGEK
jgi:hypothetical protein